MNNRIEHLYQISQKPERRILGLMSGTSLDGLDLALCIFTGSGRNTRVQVEQFATMPYDAATKAKIRTVFAKAEGSIDHLTRLHTWMADLQAQYINQCLHAWQVPASSIDAIASHGQTIYHAPQPDANLHCSGTLQIVDGDRLAMKTGIITLSDFRQKHLAAGGTGAPLAPYGDYLLFAEQTTDVWMLNIGGMANLSYLPAGNHINTMVCTDTGPGNALMDACVQHNDPTQSYDAGGERAALGTIYEPLLQQLMEDAGAKQAIPFSTGPEYFNLPWLSKKIECSGMDKININDLLATLNAFTADSIVRVMQQIKPMPTGKLYISGGGAHNHTLINRMVAQLPNITLTDTRSKGIPPDAKEAVLFALLANETLAGSLQTWGNGAPNLPAVRMGKISLPD